MAEHEIGEYVTLPVILSFRDVDKQVNDKLGKAFGGAGRKASTDFAKGASAGVDEAAKSYEKFRDKAADALGKVRVEEERLSKARASGKSDLIAAAEERHAKALRDSSRATREAESAHSVLLSAQKRLGDSTDDTRGRLSRMGDVLDGAKGKMLAAGAVAGGAAVAGVAALGAGVAVTANRLYELGSSLDELSDKLQIRTGASGSELDALVASVQKLGTTNVPSSFAEIGDVAAEVTRNLHLTGQPLEEITSRLANLSRMGQDVDVRTLGRAFRGLGVDVEDQVPALNSLYELSTKTGLSIDDITGSISKAIAPLQALGLTFGESAALAAQLDAAGLDVDKMLSGGLTKSLATLAKAGQSGREALAGTVDEIRRLNEAGDEASARELANKLFGQRGGEQFFDAIRRGDLDLRNLSSSLALTGLDINRVADDTADWSERWQILKNEAADALEPLAGRLFDAVNAELDEAADSLSDHREEIVEFFADVADVAITGAENFAHGIGGMLQALGDMMGGIGNVKGALDDTMAVFATIRGDDLAAEQFRKSADEARGWGENLRSAGDKLTQLDLDPLRDAIESVADEAAIADTNLGGATDRVGAIGQAAGPAADELARMREEMEKIARSPLPALPGAPPGLTPGQSPFDVLPGPSGLEGLRPGGGGSGVGINLQLAASGPSKLRDTGSRPSVPHAQTTAAALTQMFPGIASIGGSANRPAGTPQMHTQGRALDIGIGEVTPENQAMGDQINAWLRAHAAELGVESTIWRDVWQDFKGNQSRVSGHQDHIHAQFSAGPPGGTTGLTARTGAAGGGLWDEIAQAESGGDWSNDNTGGHMTSSGAPRGGLQITDQTWAAFGGTEFAPTANRATKQQQIAVAERIAFTGYNGQPPQGLGAWEVVTKGLTPNVTTSTPASAFAATPTGMPIAGNYPTTVQYDDEGFPVTRYGPPGATAGTNEYGEPGFYVPDPKAIERANEALEAIDDRIADADEAAAEARRERDELDQLATEDERRRADRAVERAEKTAAEAREDKQDALSELDEVQRGTFTPGKEVPGQKRGRDRSRRGEQQTGIGMGDLSPLGDIAGSFLKETFGIGSWLPDISDNMFLQAGDALLSAFSGPLQGALEGKLGIQQPGWRPGMPVEAFGAPDVTAPPMPPTGVHGGGGGLPGPPTVINDVHTEFNGNVGWDPAEVRRQDDRAKDRGIARLTGFPMGLR